MSEVGNGDVVVLGTVEPSASKPKRRRRTETLPCVRVEVAVPRGMTADHVWAVVQATIEGEGLLVKRRMRESKEV